MTNFKKMRSSYIKCKPWVKWLICHYMRLLKAFTFFSFQLTIWIAKKRSKTAFGWHIVAIYLAWACWTTYWLFRVTVFRIFPFKLVKSMDWKVIKWKFLFYLFWVRCIILNLCLMQPLLNLMVLLFSFSLFLTNKLALYSCSSFFIANVLFARNKISSVWRPIISNLLLLFLVFNK